MADKAWKAFERAAADLIGGKRKWANSGERLDVESDAFIGQCKLVQRLSLSELTSLAVEMEKVAYGLEKFGLVFTKLRAGKGKRTPILVTMTVHEFENIVALADLKRGTEETNDQATEAPAAAPVHPGPGLPGDPASEAQGA